MKRFNLVFVPAVAAAALTLFGCDESKPSKVCVDQYNTRVDDANCKSDDQTTRSDGSGYWVYRWFYYRSPSYVPALGSTVDSDDGSFSKSSSTTYSTVSRGGFGESAESFGGEGAHGGFGE